MYPVGDAGCDSDALNVNFDIFGEIPELGLADALEVISNPRDGKFESSDSSLDVGDDIGSRV